MLAHMSVGPKVYVNDQQEQLCVKMLTCTFMGQLAVGREPDNMNGSPKMYTIVYYRIATDNCNRIKSECVEVSRSQYEEVLPS